MTALYSERGFIIHVEDDQYRKGTKWYSNPAINLIYMEQTNPQFNRTSWEWLGKVTELIVRQFHQMPRFLEFQLTSGNPLPFRCVDFIMSTLEYLKMGRRRIAVNSWFDLLEVNPKVMTAVNASVVREAQRDYAYLLSMTATELVCEWLKYPDGLDDLMTTAMILFGDAEPVRKP